MAILELTPPPVERPIRRRTRRDPKPRFKADCTLQLDAVLGCPALIVPEDHLARAVLQIVAEFDVSAIESEYSSLGRRGYRPRNLLAVWIYASLVGEHYASAVARRIVTDAAFRLLSGGHLISATRLKYFRAHNRALFLQAIEKTVAIANARGLLKTDEMAIDSLRLRAHASKSQTRTRLHSEKRLADLSAVDESSLGETGLASHRAKVEKHAAAVARCEESGRNSVVMTNPLASMMKFPDGGIAPAHRVTALAAGAKERFIVGVLVTADANDSGQLSAIVEQALPVLGRAGVPDDAPLQGAADAGYCSHEDLAYADRIRGRFDVLINIEVPTGPRPHLFGRDRFIVDENGARCPAGRAMKGPWPRRDGFVEFMGVGCSDCPLRQQCTDSKARSLTINPHLERLRAAMKARLATDEGERRYAKRMATVEPVFSNLESVMNFQRATSRKSETVVAEVLLKVLAHNISRLLSADRLRLVYCLVMEDGSLVALPA